MVTGDTAPGAPGIAVIGAGSMARAHAYGYLAAPLIWSLRDRPRLVVLCSRDAGRAENAARTLGFGEHATDWRQVVDRGDVDIVDICTPPGAHAEVIAAAAAAGKAVICEKPLAASTAEAKLALTAVTAARVLNAIGFNYRRIPALALMRRMIADGAVGVPRLWRASWLSDEFGDPSTAFDWRFEHATGGSTVADLGSHLIDLAEWMLGPIAEASAAASTFTPERRAGDGTMAPVDVADSTAALLRFSDGALGTLEVAKICQRRPCDFTVEVNGTDGTLVFDYSRLNELRFGSRADDRTLYGLRTIRVEDPAHPYADRWWAAGQGIGYGATFVNQAGELLAAWPTGPWDPDFAVGLRVQQVCEAIERSAATRGWCQVSEYAAAAA
jgi:predicted dehydrogenase